jgi:hypothetical protein
MDDQQRDAAKSLIADMAKGEIERVVTDDGGRAVIVRLADGRCVIVLPEAEG